jgi:hypothetical protein
VRFLTQPGRLFGATSHEPASIRLAESVARSRRGATRRGQPQRTAQRMTKSDANAASPCFLEGRSTAGSRPVRCSDFLARGLFLSWRRHGQVRCQDVRRFRLQLSALFSVIAGRPTPRPFPLIAKNFPYRACPTYFSCHEELEEIGRWTRAACGIAVAKHVRQRYVARRR